METRQLGRTRLSVSALSLGTVSLGVDYGIPVPGDFGRPDEDDAVRLIREAVDRKITLIDTAPTYGEAERIVGRALSRRPDVVVATKLLPSAIEAGADAIQASIASSLSALQRDVLDIVQVPNATAALIGNRAVIRALSAAKDAGIVRFLGATVYDESAALAVIRSGRFDVLQVACDLLDQRKLHEVIPKAHEAGVGVIVRSAFLKGVLTRKAEHLPPELDQLRELAKNARDTLAGGSWDELAKVAVRFCLSEMRVSTVLTGARTVTELEAALEAEDAGPLEPATLQRARTLGIDNEELLNPSLWRSVP